MAAIGEAMSSLEVVARPDFDKADLAWLTEIRAERTDIPGPPKFTLVFPGADMEPAAFAALVTARAHGVPRIRFRLRSALVVPEVAVRRFHVFLVPDEGFGAIVRLHDRLHSGPIEACLRPDTPYLPHITIATTGSFAAARKAAASLNADDMSIEGVVETLVVERRDGAVVTPIAEIHLAKVGWFS